MDFVFVHGCVPSLRSFPVTFQVLLEEAMQGIVLSDRDGETASKGAHHSKTHPAHSNTPEPPGEGTRTQSTAGWLLCSSPALRSALTCSSGPAAALAWSLAPEASSLVSAADLEDYSWGESAAAIQARGQKHLRCSGQGLHLQEGKEHLCSM